MFAKKWTLYSPTFDFLFFFLPFFATFIFVKISEQFYPGILYPENSPIWFFLFAIVFDVGHVWGTLYRGYLQKNIFIKHKKVLIGIPIISISILILLASIDLPNHDPFYLPLAFLAYVAVFHFIKQQVGFIHLYGRNCEKLGSMETASKKIDTLITWVITGFPFLYWMMHYADISLNWFIPGEYILLSGIIPKTELIWMIYFIGCMIYIIFQILLSVRGAKLNPLKYAYIIGTAYIWYNGMVSYNSIIIFGFGNILLHGLNYYGIVIGSTFRNNSYGIQIQSLKKLGLVIFSAILFLSLMLLGYSEEFLWDQFIWREKVMIFSDIFYNIGYNHFILIIIFSILGSVQLTHYILDRYIWRGDFGKIM